MSVPEAVVESTRECAADGIQGYVTTAREQHGDLSPGYFRELERISYRVWSDLDRSEVFAVEWLSD